MYAKRRRKQYFWCWLFILPTTLFYAAFQAWPILSSIYYSTLDWSGISSKKTFVGLDNFVELFHDQWFWNAFANSFKYMSVRYYVTLADAPDNDAWMSYSNGSRQVNVYEDTSALPIGFCYDTYMTGSELEAVDPAERAHAMLKTLVVSDEDADKVSGVLRHYDASVDGEISGDSKAADMDRRREACSETFDYGTDFFRSEITSDTDQYAFFSVPYDKSWHATVNGEAVEILKVNGLMAVPVTAGHNTIQFRYSPTPLWIGIGLSIVSLILSLIYVKQRRPAAAH